MNARDIKAFSARRVIVQFAKWPELGKVKTRMQPHLTPEQSVRLHKQLLSYCCEALYDEGRWNYQLWLAGGEHLWNPADMHNVLLSLGIYASPEIHVQGAGDLGDKMSHAALQSMTRYQNVVIIGSDCPFISPSYIEQAFTQLEQGDDIVIGPANDGGYVLLGLRAPSSQQSVPTLFEDMPWSQSHLLDVTLEKIRATKLSLSLLETLSDIDRPEDLDLLGNVQREQAWF